MFGHGRARLFVSLFALLFIGSIFAVALASAPARADATPTPSPSPTIVRELVNERTATSDTYLLSDGSRQVRVSEDPINYKDDSGNWQTINTNLLTSGSLGDYQSASTPVDVSIGDEGLGQDPVSVSYQGANVSFNLLSAVEDDNFVAGDTATFPDVTTATNLNYQVLADGLKEDEIVLASSAAPNNFTFFVSHPGLSLRQDDAGQ